MSARTALIAGATGAVAKRLIELLATDASWGAIGLCRNPPYGDERIRWVSADLGDAEQCRRALAGHPEITHVFYCARAKHGEGGFESVEENVAMLRSVLDAVETTARDLSHVHLVEGGKWYGLHLGPYPTPAHEDDPRHMPPNFYYDQEDLLRARQAGKSWTWSASRPNVICDFAPERPRNIVSIIGAYAAICAELGLRFDFPGKPGNYSALTELTDASLFARGMVHMATTPACENRAFNITNGDLIRWESVWPRIARLFGLEPGTVRTLHLSRWMQDKDPVWARIVEKHNLVPRRLDEVALWGFADFVFGQDYDVISNLNRLRGTGFYETIDTTEMLLSQLQQYRKARILP